MSTERHFGVADADRMDAGREERHRVRRRDVAIRWLGLEAAENHRHDLVVLLLAQDAAVRHELREQLEATRQEVHARFGRARAMV